MLLSSDHESGEDSMMLENWGGFRIESRCIPRQVSEAMGVDDKAGIGIYRRNGECIFLYDDWARGAGGRGRSSWWEVCRGIMYEISSLYMVKSYLGR